MTYDPTILNLTTEWLDRRDVQRATAGGIPPAHDLWQQYKVLYRATPTTLLNGETLLAVRAYRVERTTPCGWIVDHGRFVHHATRKRWASPTRQLAVYAAGRRWARRHLILSAQLRHADDVLALFRREAHKATPEV